LLGLVVARGLALLDTEEALDILTAGLVDEEVNGLVDGEPEGVTDEEAAPDGLMELLIETVGELEVEASLD